MDNRNFDLGRFFDLSLSILLSLANGPRHGHAIIEDIAEICGTRLEPGTLYAALTRMERRGWIEALDTLERRRPYRITGAGEHVRREQLKLLNRIDVLRLQSLTSS
ncbi:MAG TPA: helix-turn-helix transcriptional regulator [Ktedonobacteraceae bacterium]